MIKSAEKTDKTVFNYLGELNSAVFSAYTDLYGEKHIPEGVVWLQYDKNGNLTAVSATGKDNKSLCFTNENTDFDELSFITGDVIITTDEFPFERIDKKYLMVKKLDNVTSDKGIKYTDYSLIKGLDGKENSNNRRIAEKKAYLNLQKLCEGVLIEACGEYVSGGFINFGNGFSVITDVFTKEKYRNKGYGLLTVKKLLSCSVYETVYLTSKEHNVSFYEKAGFKIAKEIYEYRK